MRTENHLFHHAAPVQQRGTRQLQCCGARRLHVHIRTTARLEGGEVERFHLQQGCAVVRAMPVRGVVVAGQPRASRKARRVPA